MGDQPQYCDDCGVSTDLHYTDAPEGCADAERKADLMDAFWGAVLPRGVGRG